MADQAEDHPPMTARERLLALVKEVQDEGYGTIQLGARPWGQRVPAYPFVVLGLLMAVEVLDGTR